MLLKNDLESHRIKTAEWRKCSIDDGLLTPKADLEDEQPCHC